MDFWKVWLHVKKFYFVEMFGHFSRKAKTSFKTSEKKLKTSLSFLMLYLQ